MSDGRRKEADDKEEEAYRLANDLPTMAQARKEWFAQTQLQDREETRTYRPCSEIAATPDMIDHPVHYNQGGFEIHDVIVAFKLVYDIATVAKYIFRAQYKGEELQDLKKARWHLAARIKELENDQND